MQIDKDVPIPSTRHDYPFPDMNVGDSFAAGKDQANNIRMAAQRYKKENPLWDYTTRTDEFTVRLWRTV